jgi:rhomboid family GlyGly-CTERM serine protease
MQVIAKNQEIWIEGRAIDLLHRNWLTLTLLMAAVVMSLMPGTVEVFEFNREAILNGQLWRVVTGNFVHWNTDHLIWDALMFGVLGAAIERRHRGALAIAALVTAIAVSATVSFATSLTTYRGLSGIDSALFVMLAAWYLADGLKSRRTLLVSISAVFLLGFIAKICYEIATGHTYFVDSSAAAFIPLPQVHLAGAAIGLAVLGGIQLGLLAQPKKEV